MHRVVLLACATGCRGYDLGELPSGETEDLGVQRLVFPFVDESRPTGAFTDLPASDVRTLETWVWLPGGQTSGEVVLMAHGNGGHPDRFVFLAESLAGHGAVVVAPIFPATNRDGDSAGLAIGDLYEQPADLAYVRRAVALEAADPGSELYGRVDVGRAVAVGHSLGGATVAGWTRWGDAPQTDLLATVLVAPAVFLNGNFGEGPHVEGPPLQLIHGDEDGVVPPSISEGLFDEVGEPAALAMYPGEGHVAVMEGDSASARRTFEMVRGVFDTVTGADPDAWSEALDAAEAGGIDVERRGL